MAGDQRLQVGNDGGVLAQCQAGVDETLGDIEAEELESRRFGTRPLGPIEIRERRAAPPSQRLGETGCNGLGFFLARCGRMLEPRRVDLVSEDLERVAGRPSADGVRPEHLAQLVHVGLQCADRRHRRCVAPDRVDQGVVRDSLVWAQEEQSEDGSELRAADLALVTVDDHFERPQDAELHRGAEPTGS